MVHLFCIVKKKNKIPPQIAQWREYLSLSGMLNWSFRGKVLSLDRFSRLIGDDICATVLVALLSVEFNRSA